MTGPYECIGGPKHGAWFGALQGNRLAFPLSADLDDDDPQPASGRRLVYYRLDFVIDDAGGERLVWLFDDMSDARVIAALQREPVGFL